MADDTATVNTSRIPWQNMTLKGALAFYLVTIASLLVVFFMVGVFVFKVSLDAGMLALLASFITYILKMASSASDYQFTSSAGSDKKDDNNAKVASTLAEKVPPAGAVAVAPDPVVVVAWWSRLDESERTVIATAAKNDPRAAAIMAAAQTGKATPDDLAYLASQGLLPRDRAAVIQAT